MSNDMSFEAIVTGQLPPDEWYELSLDKTYPLLEPVSALGLLALESATELADTETRRLDAYDETDVDDYITADEARELAEDRDDIFWSMYTEIECGIRGTRVMNITPDMLDEIVSDVTREERAKVYNNPYFSLETKVNLTHYTGLLRMLYLIEGDTHFQAIQTPTCSD